MSCGNTQVSCHLVQPTSKQTVTIQKQITTLLLTLISQCCSINLYSQNSLTGDGFGGRSWYVAHNYQVGAYSGYTVCGPTDQLYAWGSNIHGELGIGTLISNTTPVPVPNMTNVKFYTTGYVSGVIKKDSTAWIWGAVYDFTGMVITPNPTQVLSDVKFIDGGLTHIVFVKHDGTVWGAGRNYKGELGNGINSSPIVIIPPVQMTGVTNAVRAIAIGGLTGSSPATMILLADSTVKITGGEGQFMQVSNSIPVKLPGLNNIVDIKGNNIAAFALNSSGEVYSFGTETSLGSLGLGVPPFTYMPPTKITFPAGAAPIIALSANNDGFSALALDENGNVYGWGYNVHGELGDGTFITRNSPKLVATNTKDIFAGETFSYILKADNSLWATGRSGWPNSGGYDYGSIWMNQTNVMRNNFTLIDPTNSQWNLCVPKPFGSVAQPTAPIIDSLCRLDSILKIYPVPSHRTLTIEKKSSLCKVTMNIYNSIGQLMIKDKIIKDGKNEIELSNFAGGVYFAQFISNGKALLTRKILKQ